ncbi:M16 family metallopeptidase [Polycladidibacter stylochi]|uniref:M16 family metallopeptidase n=1 Tax=Polycladidibacter stylochi TaxID=1807766 RepID=UPI0008301FA7|nr:insulinase family protein [Pseudovibrio stylochi]
MFVYAQFIAMFILVLSIFGLSGCQEKQNPEIAPNIYYAPINGSNAVSVHLIFENTSDQPGLMHYLEHLVGHNIKGPNDRVFVQHANAWTTRYSVGYWRSGKPDKLEQLLASLRKTIEPLEVGEEYALEERGIVLNEYDFRLGNNYSAQAFEEINATLHAGNRIATSVIGTPKQINELRYDDAVILHQKSHVVQQAKLVVTGDVSLSQLRRALERVEWPVASTSNQFGAGRYHLKKAFTQRLEFADENTVPRFVWQKVIALDTPVELELLRAQTALLSSILESNLPGGLAGPLRFDGTTTSGFSFQVFPLDEKHLQINFSGKPDKGVKLVDVEAEFQAELLKLAKQGIPPKTWQRLRKRFDDYWPDLEDQGNVEKWYARYVTSSIYQQKEPKSVKKLLRMKNGISQEETNKYLKLLVGEGAQVIAFIGPEEVFR